MDFTAPSVFCYQHFQPVDFESARITEERCEANWQFYRELDLETGKISYSRQTCKEAAHNESCEETVSFEG